MIKYNVTELNNNLISKLVLKEKINMTQGIGIFVIIIGVCVMTFGGK